MLLPMCAGLLSARVMRYAAVDVRLLDRVDGVVHHLKWFCQATSMCKLALLCQGNPVSCTLNDPRNSTLIGRVQEAASDVVSGTRPEAIRYYAACQFEKPVQLTQNSSISTLICAH